MGKVFASDLAEDVLQLLWVKGFEVALCFHPGENVQAHVSLVPLAGDLVDVHEALAVGTVQLSPQTHQEVAKLLADPTGHRC